jgi:hypothetical protein
LNASSGVFCAPIAHDFDERVPEALGRHRAGGGSKQQVRRHLDIEIDDDAEQAVAAHGVGEQLRVLLARTGDERSVGE